jgi:decaprenylphospho-beta-D-ribofuranose 2-oxidase
VLHIGEGRLTSSQDRTASGRLIIPSQDRTASGRLLTPAQERTASGRLLTPLGAGTSSSYDLAPDPIASWSNVLPTRTRLVAYQPEAAARLGRTALPMIFRGGGRSFGDCSYVSGGTTLTSQRFDAILALDRTHGVVDCESGVQMIALHTALKNSGWSFPIYGGTRWATVGGAVASDIHGKNHTGAGSFGNHVAAMTIVTADGSQIEASPSAYPDLFAATIGGLGLTGFVKSVRLSLAPTSSETLNVRSTRFDGVDGMRACFESADAPFQFVWLDDACREGARGLHYFAAFSRESRPARPDPAIRQPPYVRLLYPSTIRAVNWLRYQYHGDLNQRMHAIDFNYWADRYDSRRRLFGRRGFHEYHLLVPEEHVRELLTVFHRRLRRAGITPYFTVVKRFGPTPARGLISFPSAGYTMNTQFDNTPATIAFLRSFTDLVADLGGRVYLAKDSCITKAQFLRMYPVIDRWREIVRRYDPRGLIQSDLSRRLDLKPW